MIKFSIVITTKNRINDLKFTLNSLNSLLEREDVELLIVDDFSSDGTQEFLKESYKKHTLIFNNKSLGLIYNRNVLNSLSKGSYVISLDDDANFLSDNVLENIEDYFLKNLECGVIACRIFWSKNLPIKTASKNTPERVKGFVGCGHVWRKESWESIPEYPAWFQFYGEEDFASYQLFKKDIEIHYVPKILVHHRVDNKARKKAKDYNVRLRRSIRSGWYLYFLFYPISKIPKKILYSVYMQYKTKIFKGDFRVLIALLQAKVDLFLNLPNIYKLKNRFTKKELKEYQKLSTTKIYWSPEK